MNVKSYLSPKTKVKKSKIKGSGLFAMRPIKKRELVGIKGGHIINWETLNKHKRLIDDSYLQIDDDFILAPLEKSEVNKVMMFLNHSCNPNVGVRGEITFIAMCDIKPREELTVDYAMIDDDDFKMECNCGTKKCREVVTGRDWKRKDLQKKYKGFFSAYVQEKINGLNKWN